jgi:phospholipid/cholesterol/gamma-HCH transport system substrate-binding protein
MDERVLRFYVGVVVISAALLTGILIFLLGEGQAFFQRRYTIFLRFPQAPGVTVDTPVRKHGVLIGRVKEVRLQEEGGVMLTVWIDARYKLRRNEVCRIGTSSFLGDAVLEFVPKGDEVASNEVIQDGDLLADGFVASDPLKVLTNLEGNMQTTIKSIETAADEVALLARNLNDTLSGDRGQIQRIVAKSELALDTFQSTMSSIDGLLGDPELKAGLKQSLSDLPLVFDDVRATLTEAQQTLASFERVSSKAERNLDNLEAFTEPLSQRGADLAENFDATLQNLDILLSQLVTFSQAINSKEGTLGQLVHDRELYDRINQAARNVEDATRRIRPIIEDVRIFTDKIATDPRVLGVKGALDQKPLGTGQKWPLR